MDEQKAEPFIIKSGDSAFEFDREKSKINFPGGSAIGDTAYYPSSTDIMLKPGPGGYAGITSEDDCNYARVSENDFTIGTDFPTNKFHWIFDRFGILQVPGPVSLKIYKDEESRDKLIPCPYTGMMIYVLRLGMQVYGETKWNTIPGSGD